MDILRDVSIELEEVPKIVVACCVLHNFIQMNHGDGIETHIDPHPNYTTQLQSQAMDRSRLSTNIYYIL